MFGMVLLLLPVIIGQSVFFADKLRHADSRIGVVKELMANMKVLPPLSLSSSSMFALLN